MEHQHQARLPGILLFLLPWLLISPAGTESRYLPEFEHAMPNQTVTLGGEAILTCHVSHLGGYKVGWIKSDSKAIQAIHTHVITHNPRVSVRHSGTTTWQLVLSNVQREDEGLFMCQINTDPMKSQVAYLRVVVPPEIESTSDGAGNHHDVMTSEGSSVKLSCKARGDPQPTVRWHREDGEDITMRTINGERLRFSSYEGETLTLMKISRLDMGVYICSASNGIPPAASRRIAVNINFNPVVNVPNQLIWSPLGNNFTMECNVEAYPRSVNYWIRGDGELIISGSKFGVSEVRESIFASRMSLTVHNFEKFDIGKYRCIAKNSLGEVEGRIHVYESHAWPNNRGATVKTISNNYQTDEVEEEVEESDGNRERETNEIDDNNQNHQVEDDEEVTNHQDDTESDSMQQKQATESSWRRRNTLNNSASSISPMMNNSIINMISILLLLLVNVVVLHSK